MPESTKKEDKNDIVIAWEAVAPPREELEARAGGPVAPAERATKKTKQQPKKKPKRTEPDSSDEEDEDSDEDIDQDDIVDGRGRDASEACDDEDGSESEDEGEDEDEGDEDDEDAEETYDVKCIRAQKGKGKKLEYHVEWEGHDGEGKPWPLTWEPAAFLSGTFALEDWEASQKKKK